MRCALRADVPRPRLAWPPAGAPPPPSAAHLERAILRDALPAPSNALGRGRRRGVAVGQRHAARRACGGGSIGRCAGGRKVGQLGRQGAAVGQGHHGMLLLEVPGLLVGLLVGLGVGRGVTGNVQALRHQARQGLRPVPAALHDCLLLSGAARSLRAVRGQERRRLVGRAQPAPAPARRARRPPRCHSSARGAPSKREQRRWPSRLPSPPVSLSCSLGVTRVSNGDEWSAECAGRSATASFAWRS